ncbi:MAG: DUF6090 family protein [Robiginitalea sp.]
MLRFFRQIRQRLLTNNKFSKYLLYIGILIALQIDNWNEDRKERALEQKVLIQIYNSISQDTNALNQEYRYFQRVLDAANLIKARLDSEAPYEARLDTAFAWISNINVVEAEYTAFNRLVNIGVDLVKDDSLRNALVSYYDHSRWLKEVEIYYENSKYFRTVIYPKYFKNFEHSRKAEPVDFQALKQANDFRIALDYSINDAKWYRGWSEHRKEDAIELLSLLKARMGKEVTESYPKPNGP